MRGAEKRVPCFVRNATLRKKEQELTYQRTFQITQQLRWYVTLKFSGIFFSLNFQEMKNDAYEDILKILVEHQRASKNLWPKDTSKRCKKGYFLHKLINHHQYVFQGDIKSLSSFRKKQ